MTKKVTVYTAEGCGPCKLLLQQLDKLGVEYEAVDVTDADLEFTRMPQMVFPDDSILTGFNSRKVRKKVRELGL